MTVMAHLIALSQVLSLEGKRALITGAASGIGKAIASRFAEAGAALELVDVDADRLAAESLVCVLDVPGDDRAAAQEGRHYHQYWID